MFGFVGGGEEGNDGGDILRTFQREFDEEVGTSNDGLSIISFTSEDHMFSTQENNKNKQISYFFCRIVDDLELFNLVLSTFYTDCKRKDYLEEVLSITGLPIFIEGPIVKVQGDKISDIFLQTDNNTTKTEDIDRPEPKLSWNNNAQGLPRYLQNNGMLTPTFSNNNRPRETLILCLLKCEMLSYKEVERVLVLLYKIREVEEKGFIDMASKHRLIDGNLTDFICKGRVGGLEEVLGLERRNAAKRTKT